MDQNKQCLAHLWFRLSNCTSYKEYVLTEQYVLFTTRIGKDVITDHLKTTSYTLLTACEDVYHLFQKNFDADKLIVFLCFPSYSDDRVSTIPDLGYCQRSSCSGHHLV